MVSATNERQIRERNRRHSEDRRTDEEVTRALMAHMNGRRWVWLRLADAQLFINEASLDPYRMAFNLGRREFALKLLQDVNRFTPQEYIQMTAENAHFSVVPPPSDDESDDE